MKHHCNQENYTNYGWYEEAVASPRLESLPRKEGYGEVEKTHLVHSLKHFLSVHFTQDSGPLELAGSK